ncbi:transcription regulator NOT2/NOT3/NOT5-like protein [Tanacetum coccineum]
MMAPVKKRFRSSSSEENKKMKSMMIGDDDEIKATRQKLMLDFHKKVDLAKAQSTNAVGGFREFFLPLQQLVTSGVGLSPILGNPGSRITGSAVNIGGRSSIGRSMSSGGGLSIPCLTSILNLNTNSGFGNLNV